MKVHEIMTGHARSVSPDTTLIEAAGLMRELDVGALPVCEGDAIAGIVTDRDLVVRGLADGLNPSTARVSQVMSGGIVGVSAGDEVEEAVRIMEHHQIRRLPVLDRSRKLVGIVSLGDIAMSSNPAFSGMALRDVSEPANPNSRRRRLQQQSEPSRMPAVPGTPRGPAERAPAGSSSTRRGSGGRSASARAPAAKTASHRRRTTKGSATRSGRTRAKKSAKRSRR